jgi:tetratricopeptide (TPR) repeat protein
VNRAKLICLITVAASSLALGEGESPAPNPSEKSPAEVGIQKAQAQIALKPDHIPYYNALAMAYARRARETSDVAFYQKGEETVAKALELSPGNFETEKVRVWLLLGRHEFRKALDAAIPLNKKVPDDVTVYGYIADANTELGNYPAAVDAIQWMLRIKPGNIAGLTRAAYQREIHGDIVGAMELMRMAYDATAYQEFEDRAWLLTQLSHLSLINNDLKNAELYANGALGLFPAYHYALAALAQVREAQNRPQDAVELLAQRYKAAPHAENLFSLAEALKRSGHDAEADQAFAQFEKASLAESNIGDNSNHELMAYYVDDAKQPQKALVIAEKELLRRRDITTLDCYAWALAAAGEYQKAGAEMKKVLAVGTKDPKILAHAKQIEQGAKLAEQARLDPPNR